MGPDRWRQIDEIFDAALDLSPSERATLLDDACGDDASLRSEVERLLEIDARTGDFIESSALDAATEILVTPAAAPSRPRAPEKAHSSPAPATAGSIDDARFVAGELIADRYRIVGLLGRGGMGEVYRAEDLKLKQAVALKFLPEKLSAHGAALARFYQEVSIARQISHRNVCRVYDVGEARGLHFISMEYVRGEELASLLKRIGRLPEDKAIDIARQLCGGLAAIHESGVLHRDLKPANVMLDERGDVRITDFGIAALLADGVDRGAPAGTPAYMSPEQLDGKELTVRSDLYSLGLVFYEIFTGRRAFSARTLAELLEQRRSNATPSAPSTLVATLDPAVVRVVERCLETDPALRPASALQVAAALPGGNPLEAALAAGETPSPEMVAAADEGGLDPRIAIAVFAVSLALVVALLATGDRVQLTGTIPLEKPPEVLADRARTIARNASGDAPVRDTDFGYDLDYEAYDYVQRTDSSATRWTPPDGRPAFVTFWYRQSPQPLASSESIVVTADDPPPTSLPGMASVRLDTLGRLLELSIVPTPPGDASPERATAVDWAPLFADAGLDIATFEPVAPRWLPSTFADARFAWERRGSDGAEPALRVEAASFDARPISFKVLEPWRTAQGAVLGVRNVGLERLLVFLFVVFLSLIAAGLWLTKRNLALGRGDKKGALKTALFAFAAAFVGDVVGADHVASFGGEVALLYTATTDALAVSAVLWILYIALEPYVRRQAPHQLVGWTRLVAGRWRDPVVGRDVLVGTLLGIFINVTLFASELVSRALGAPPELNGVRLDVLTSSREVVRLVVALQLDIALLHGIGIAFLLFLLTLLVRSRTRAAVGLWLMFMTAFALLGKSAPEMLFVAIFSAAYVFVASRFGLLAVAVAQFVLFTIEFYPYTLRFDAWYGGVTLLAASIVVGLATFGLVTSVRGRPILAPRLLDE